MQEKFLGELIFARIHAGPVFALARIQENIFEEVIPEYCAKFLEEFIRCEYMPHLYSHPREYRKIFLANYLCIGFVPGGTVGTKIIADLEKMFQEFISEKLLILLRERPSQELIFVSSNFQASLFLQKKLELKMFILSKARAVDRINPQNGRNTLFYRLKKLILSKTRVLSILF